MLSDISPEPVPLRLGAREWLVSQFRLRDLASVERAAGGGTLPFWRSLGLAEELTGEDRRRRLAELFVRAEDGLPAFGDSKLDGAMASAAVKFEGLFISVRRSHRQLSREAFASSLSAMTARQFKTAERVMWAADPLDSVAAAFDADLGLPTPPDYRDCDWRKMVKQAVKAKKYWTLDVILNLHLSQWRFLFGDPEYHPIASPTPRRGWSQARIDEEITDRRADVLEEYGLAMFPVVRRNGHSANGHSGP